MWQGLWKDLRSSKSKILLDESHLRDSRDGRYQRAIQSVGRLLGSGEPIGFRFFDRQEHLDVCYLVVWKKEDYEDAGQYMVFRIYYSRQNHSADKIGYRTLVAAEICCYYDGHTPNPGRRLRSRDDALDCMREKRGYHEILR